MNDIYYQDMNGRVCCPDHVGSYAQARLEERRNVARIVTPITVWERLTAREVFEIMTYNPTVCESCTWGS